MSTTKIKINIVSAGFEPIVSTFSESHSPKSKPMSHYSTQ